MTYWSVMICHDDFYNGWPVKSWPPEVAVSAKGHPTTKSGAMFKTEAEARQFLEMNKEVIERRCANKVGFRGFDVVAGGSLSPIVYDKPTKLQKRDQR